MAVISLLLSCVYLIFLFAINDCLVIYNLNEDGSQRQFQDILLFFHIFQVSFQWVLSCYPVTHLFCTHFFIYPECTKTFQDFAPFSKIPHDSIPIFAKTFFAKRKPNETLVIYVNNFKLILLIRLHCRTKKCVCGLKSWSTWKRSTKKKSKSRQTLCTKKVKHFIVKC